MSRNFRASPAKKHVVYSVEELMNLLNVCRNTISNWVREGLRPSPVGKPYRFRGDEINRFHAMRRSRSKRSLRVGEFLCVTCKAIGLPETLTLNIYIPTKGGALGTAICPDCGSNVKKILSDTECDKLTRARNTNTSLADLAEEEGYLPARIGNKLQLDGYCGATANDRIIHEWQSFAEKNDEKTTSAQLASIRVFESYLKEEPFTKLTQNKVGRYRSKLVEQVESIGEGSISPSTARHRASHLRGFLKWLRGQPGYRGLSECLCDYLILPKKMNAARLARTKAYPTLVQGVDMVGSMPANTKWERRQRALVALVFFTGLRASAATSIKLKHIDLEGEKMFIDAQEVRSKNGKSHVVHWFPRTEYFQKIFLSWIDELRSLGFEADDAVFPRENEIQRVEYGHSGIACLRGSKAIETAFTDASEAIGEKFTPHSVRDLLAASGADLCRTPRERKAWSLNLGHASEITTECYYGKISEDEQSAIMTSLGRCSQQTHDEVILANRYFAHKIDRTDPLFEKAQALAREAEFGQVE